MAVQLPQLGPRMRKLVRYLGFAALAVVTFVFALQATLPFDRIKDKVIEALSEKYDVTIGDVDGGWLPGRVYFKAVTLRTRPTKPDEVASTLFIEQLKLDLGLLALVRSTAAVAFDAKIGPGHITGDLALSKAGISIDVVGEDLASASLPIRDVLGLPMSGKLRAAVSLELPYEKSKAGKLGPNWQKAEGRLELGCPSGCVVGDGKAKLKMKVANPGQQAFAKDGIEFGKLNIDSLLATVELKAGKLAVTRLETRSADGELHVEFAMALNQDTSQSLVTGCLRFNGSPALLKRDAKTATAISATGAPLGPDKLFHIKLDGPLREVRRIGVLCGPAINKPMDNLGGPPAKPNLTVAPEPPPAPATADIPQPPPIVTPPPPPPVAAPDGAGSTAPPAMPPAMPPVGLTSDAPPAPLH
jgi:type II secretion system protein N